MENFNTENHSLQTQLICNNKPMNKPCRYPGCKQIFRHSGYCESHAGRENDRRKDYDTLVRKRDPKLNQAAKIRSSGQWQRARRMKLMVNPICEDPFNRHSTTQTATQVHHIEGLIVSPERFDDPENLMSVCNSCHAMLEREVRA
jgi:hypothetical protein